MKRLAIHAAATLVVMLAFDSVWLGMVAAREYREQLGDVMLPSFRPTPAILFYLIYVCALSILAENALGEELPLGEIATRAAVFGLAAYATYDMTNLATLRPWTVKLAATDLAWGAALSTASAVLGTLAARRILRAMDPRRA